MSQLEFKVTSTEASYQIGDASGYRFEIRAHLDDEFGWHASVTINTFGMKTSYAAIGELIPSAEKLAEMLKEYCAKSRREEP